VHVLIYEDLQCPDCKAFQEELDKFMPSYARKGVCFEYHDFPLWKHLWAGPAAAALRFFESISASTGLEFRRWVFNHQDEVTLTNIRTEIARFAREHGIDPYRAVASIDNLELAAEVEQDRADAFAHGIRYTPTVLVEQDHFVERFPIRALISRIEAALKEK
jgi:protein-disulfide isomerase